MCTPNNPLRLIRTRGTSSLSQRRFVSTLILFWLLITVPTLHPNAVGAEAGWEQLAAKSDSLAAAGNLDSAIVVGLDCLRLMERTADVHDTVRADRTFEVGRYYSNLQRYRAADSLFAEALRLRERHLPDDHSAILKSLRYLSFTRLLTGQEARAEALLRRSLVGWEQSSDRDTNYAVRALHRMGVICMNQQRFGEAEEAYERAAAMVRVHSNPDLRQAHALMGSLAYLYGSHKRFAEAEQIYLSLINTLERADTAASDYAAGAYLNLATLYKEMGRFAEAVTCMEKALDQNIQMYGPEGYTVAINLTDLGNVLMAQGRMTEAAEAFQKSLDIKRSTAGPNDRSVANSLIMYSQCELELGRFDEALKMAFESFTIRYMKFANNYWVLPESDAVEYSQVMRNSADAFFAAFARKTDWDAATIGHAADIILATKGQVSDCMFERSQSLITSDDPELAVLMKRYGAILENVSALYARGPGDGDPAPYRRAKDSLAQTARELEQQIALRSEEFQRARDIHDVRGDRIQSLLPADAALLEFARFDQSGLGDSAAIWHYFVLVMPPDSDPVVKHLGAAAEIDSVVMAYRLLYDTLSQVWPAFSEDQLERSKSLHQYLYRRLVSPVRESLSDAELILLAPDGILNLVSFGGLQDPSGHFLIEAHALHYLAAGRDLIRLQSRQSNGIGLLAFGDIDFGTNVATHAAKASERDETIRSGGTTLPEQEGNAGTKIRADLASLPYTGREVARVAEVWRESRGEPVRVITGAEASETRFKREAGGNRVIHCATHGFFGGSKSPRGEAPSEERFGGGENPLVKSGLYFAGVNRRPGEAETIPADDGLLTALEVAGMNLRGTEWVVLSACGTGLGEVLVGEGVYGLRRAFQMAGVRTVISSLWSIPDKHTAAWMERLYAAEEVDLAQTMRRIGLEYIEQARHDGLPDHPFTWAAFIALGDWRLNRPVTE